MKKKLLVIIGAVAAVAVIAVAAVLLRNAGAGKTADRPVKLASAMDFNGWFGQGKKLSKKTDQTVYFKLTGDIKISQEGLICGGNDVIIDLNGYTITGGQNRAFSVADSTLLLQGGTVETAGAPENGGVILVQGEGCALTVEDATLSNTDDSGAAANTQGGVIYAAGSGTPAQIRVRGNSVIQGSPSGLRRSGGAVALTGESRLYLESGKISGGKAGTAGNVYLDGNSQLHILGGSVAGGTAVRNSEITGYGGNIYTQGLSRVYVVGGSIAGGTAEKDGGNLYLANTAEGGGLYFCSGTMDGGTAGECGGNLYAMDKYSAVRISGGELTGGNAANGGNVYLHNAPCELWGGTLVGVAGNEGLYSGGNIYGEMATLRIYGGTVTSGMALEYGGNICVFDSAVDIYGGSITAGAVMGAAVTRGGGNFYAGRESVVRMYGGEISGGISNCMQNEEESAAGGNVMIAGTTRMELFGGTIKDGTVYGKITRGGSVYVYGQSQRNSSVFHMYGGSVENGLLENTMRGMCIGAYSSTKTNVGDAVARIFGGTLKYTGPEKDKSRVYAIYGNKSDNGDVYLFDEAPYEGLYKKVTTGPCPDASHNTVVAEHAAGCLTQGCTEYACATCGTWYAITAEPLGHTETAEEQESCTKHTCESCQAVWYTAGTEE